MPTSEKTRKPTSEMKRFLIYSAIFAIAVDTILFLIMQFLNEDTLADYIDSASVILVFIATLLLFLAIPKVKDKSFKITMILLSSGFLLQFLYMIFWFYIFQIEQLEVMPDVSIGDAFYLGSYVLWALATLPYLRRYHNLISKKTNAIMAVYFVIAAIVILVSCNYWYNAAISYGYDWFATSVWLSYSVVSMIALSFPLAVALLYAFQGYGKGLMRYYWVYFLIPIMMIVTADIVGYTYYVIQEGSIPGQIDDFLYLAAYSITIAAAFTVVRSKQLITITSEPEIKKQIISPQQIELKKGKGYLVEDPHAIASYNIFAKLLTSEKNGELPTGYIISRQHPAEILEKFPIKSIPITWISTSAEEGAVDPTKLGILAHFIMDFFSKTQNGAVLLDGVESLIVNNDFRKINIMLEQINDFVMQYRCYLIMPIDPKAFNDRELAIMEKDFEIIPSGAVSSIAL